MTERINSARRLRALREDMNILARDYAAELDGAPLIGPVLQRLRSAMRTTAEARPSRARYFQFLAGRRCDDKLALVEALANGDPPDQGALAALMRYYSRQPDQADVEKALSYLSRMPASEERAIFSAECLLRLGRAGEARQVLEKTRAQGCSADLCIAMANAIGAEAAHAPAAEQQRLVWLSRAFGHGDLASLTLRDPDVPLTVDNLACPKAAPVLDESAPLITVIMPVFNAAEHLATSLRSITEQTWRNLEIILVDDCSTDDSIAIIEAHAARDSRIRLIRSTVNAGCYVSRNIGLAAARGTFVTFHDADDWSHPQRFETQARDLLEHGTRMANFPFWARTNTELHGLFRVANIAFVGVHHMSMMLRREPVVDRLGYFDAVRAGADTEYYFRLRHVFPRRITELAKAPFAIGRIHDANLTTSGSFGFQHFAESHVRTEYRDASEGFRQSAGPERRALYYAHPMGKRPFPAPSRLLATSRHGAPAPHAKLDVLTAGYFKPLVGSAADTAAEIAAERTMGLRAGVMHLRDADPNQLLDSRRDLAPALRTLVNDGEAIRVLPDETAACQLLLLRHPAALQEPWEELGRIDAQAVRVVIDASPRDPNGNRLYDPACCIAAMQYLFGDRVTWCAVSDTIGDAFRADGGDVAIDDVWPTVVDIDALASSNFQSFPKRRRPVAGFFAGDRPGLWPETRAELVARFPVSDRIDMQLFNGWGPVTSLIGLEPTRWHEVRPERTSPKAFLAGLDFYLAFDAADGTTIGIRPALEAAAAGAVVLASPALASALGEAALSCEAGAVEDTVLSLYASPKDYMAQRHRALTWLRKYHGLDRVTERLTALLEEEAQKASRAPATTAI